MEVELYSLLRFTLNGRVVSSLRGRLPPDKGLPVRPEQDAAWAPQPVVTLIDKNL